MRLFRSFGRRNYYLAAPALIIILGIFTLANILNFYYAFTDWSIYKDEVSFVGLENFYVLTEAGHIWPDLITTIKYAISYMIAVNIYSLFIALLLEKKSRINNFFRALLFIPILLSPIATGYIFKGILSSKGVLNNIINVFTNSDISIQWLGSVTFTLFIVSLVQAWRASGIAVLIYIAGLSTIPEELIEAAKVEGANYWQIVKNIKIPLIGPSTTINICFNLIGALNVYAFIVAMTNGGPGRATEVLNIFVIKSFSSGRLGYATAGSLILFLVVAVFAFILIPILRKREVEL